MAGNDHIADRGRRCHCVVNETAAEAVAYVVCQACGLDSTERSRDYIQLYRGDTETLNESLDRIQKTSARIIQSLVLTNSVLQSAQWRASDDANLKTIAA